MATPDRRPATPPRRDSHPLDDDPTSDDEVEALLQGDTHHEPELAREVLPRSRSKSKLDVAGSARSAPKAALARRSFSQRMLANVLGDISPVEQRIFFKEMLTQVRP